MEQGKRLFREREYVDYFSSLVRMIEQRAFVHDYRDRLLVQPSWGLELGDLAARVEAAGFELDVENVSGAM